VMQSWLLWGMLPLVVFWAVGAYNRLVRLRARSKTAFTQLDVQWSRQLTLVQSSIPEEGYAAADATEALWVTLKSAHAQLQTALGACRTNPLHVDHAMALQAATGVMVTAWEGAVREGHDLAGAILPEKQVTEWQQLQQQTMDAQAQFNAAITDYNTAIGQFPAMMLASLFGFKPAKTL
jgi:LemA protein